SVVEVVVKADIHPHVAPAVRRHCRLPHVAFVVGVVAGLINIREAEVDGRPAEAMMAPMLNVSLDMTLNLANAGAVGAAVEVNLRLATVAVVEVNLATRTTG